MLGLIDRKLFKAEAKRRVLSGPKEVDEAINHFKQRNNIPDDETWPRDCQPGTVVERIQAADCRSNNQDRLRRWR
jgi:hypothetical protein